MNLFKYLFSPKGRVRRFSFVYTWCIVLLFVSMASVFAVNNDYLWFAPLALLPLTIRRLHDVGMSGINSFIIYQVYGLWALQLLGLNSIHFMGYDISMLTLIYYTAWPSTLCVFYLMMKKGDQGSNEYGADPLWNLAPRVTLQEFLSWSDEAKSWALTPLFTLRLALKKKRTV